MSANTLATESSDGGVIPGVSPQVYSDRDFQRVSALVRKNSGIVLDKGKRMLAYSRIAPLLRNSRYTTFAEFLDALEADKDLTVKTVAALTTNHTYFNREEHHFEHFASQVRPDLLARANAGEAIRIWSAACSSGEEIWTLLMTLLGDNKQIGSRILSQNIVALASDLAEHILEKAQEATYPADAVSKVPEPLRRNWTEPDGEHLKISDAVKKMVRFRQLNLLGDWPFKTQFDVIFCRNVMIYFDQPTKQDLVLKLAQHLRPGGYLYIGHSERVQGQGAELLECVGPTIYRRRSL